MAVTGTVCNFVYQAKHPRAAGSGEPRSSLGTVCWPIPPRGKVRVSEGRGMEQGQFLA